MWIFSFEFASVIQPWWVAEWIDGGGVKFPKHKGLCLIYNRKLNPREGQVLCSITSFCKWQGTKIGTILRLRYFNRRSFKHVCRYFPPNLQAKRQPWGRLRWWRGEISKARGLAWFTSETTTLSEFKFCFQSHQFVRRKNCTILRLRILIWDPWSMCANLISKFASEKTAMLWAAEMMGNHTMMK